MSAAISVIMPTYNGEEFLRETIESILNQSFKDFLFIIIDDGSTDKTIKIIESYHDDRIMLKKSFHTGKPAALNLALQSVSTDLVAFIDHDDIASPNRLELQSHWLTNHQSIGILGSWYYICDEKGRIVRGVRFPQDHNEIEKMMTTHCSIGFTGLMMRTALFRDFGYFDESIVTGADDYDLFLRLLPHTKFHNIPEYLMYRRRHKKSFSYTVREEQNNSVRIMALKYLTVKEKETSALKGEIYFRMGLTEYYHGSMKTSREYFHKALRNGYGRLLFNRYYWATFLGDTFFRLYRNYINEKRYAF